MRSEKKGVMEKGYGTPPALLCSAVPWSLLLAPSLAAGPWLSACHCLSFMAGHGLVHLLVGGQSQHVLGDEV